MIQTKNHKFITKHVSAINFSQKNVTGPSVKVFCYERAVYKLEPPS